MEPIAVKAPHERTPFHAPPVPPFPVASRPCPTVFGRDPSMTLVSHPLILAVADPVARTALARQLAHDPRWQVTVVAHQEAVPEALAAAPAPPVLLAETAWVPEVPPDALVCLGAAPPDRPDSALPLPTPLAPLLARLARALPGHAVGPWRFHPQTRQMVRADAPPLTLTEKEAALLTALLAAAPAPCPRDTLLTEVWGLDPSTDTHTVETHVYHLRQKLEADPENPTLLRTAPGDGYVLTP